MKPPELIVEGRTFPLLYGLYQALITEPIEFDAATEAQAHSYSYATRLDLDGRAGRQWWTITPPPDYFYHLEGLRVFFPAATQGAASVLYVNVVDNERSRNITHQDVAVHTLTTPASARPKHHMVRLNTLFGPAMHCVISVTGQTGTAPLYVDLMTEGILIPSMGLRPGAEPWQ